MDYCLGLEGTAHTFGAAVVSGKGDILSNHRHMYIPEKGGIHPREATLHHIEKADTIINSAIEESGINTEDLSCIAFSQGPGLGPCLRTTATAARSLSLKFKVPLIGVNHCVAHVEIGRLETGMNKPVTLYVSGGNSLITSFEGNRYRVFGETLDIAVGNLLDTFARNVGLAHPGGPKVEKIAEEYLLKTDGKPELIELPYSVKGMDISLSGLLTCCIRRFKEGVSLDRLCYSIQEYAFSMVSEVTERAIAHTGNNEILLTGGVAQNKRLEAMLKEIAKDHGSRFARVSPKLAGDNGAMIAWTGILGFQSRDYLDINQSQILPKWRIDQVPIPWITEG
ncbi:MAG: bifunctional N(6)-L-threonylcarbamoyladenine synthase/serine/threonine protein kinase [Candidatus Ranarchaeia archaeon]